VTKQNIWTEATDKEEGAASNAIYPLSLFHMCSQQ